MTVSERPKQDKIAGLPAERIQGRYVTKYDPAMALEVLEKIAAGETLSKICTPGSKYPHPTTFKRWVVNHPELAKAYEAARIMSGVALEEEALDMAREIKAKQRDGTQVRAFEVAMQQLRWSAERRDPEKFANRGAVNIRIPIQINTTLDLGSQGGSEIDGKSIYTISAKHRNDVETAVEAVKDAEFHEPIATGVPVKHKIPPEKPEK